MPFNLHISKKLNFLHKLKKPHCHHSTEKITEILGAKDLDSIIYDYKKQMEAHENYQFCFSIKKKDLAMLELKRKIQDYKMLQNFFKIDDSFVHIFFHAEFY